MGVLAVHGSDSAKRLHVPKIKLAPARDKPATVRAHRERLSADAGRFAQALARTGIPDRELVTFRIMAVRENELRIGRKPGPHVPPLRPGLQSVLASSRRQIPDLNGVLVEV